MKIRHELIDTDRAAILELVRATGFFSEAEADIAVELVDERREKGDASDYYFIVGEDEEGVLGYTCYGPTPATQGSWDLYWIVVHPRAQRGGHGRTLMAASEEAIRTRGGTKVWVETSGRSQYEPTRAFYLRAGYHVAAELTDFYALGESKVIFAKRVDEAQGAC